MKSGSPEPLSELNLILQEKRNAPSITCEVVSTASAWVKAELVGASISFHYATCDDRDHYGFSVFTLVREVKGVFAFSLRLKIAEIGGVAHAFADVHRAGREPSATFPFFGELGSHHGRMQLLHYISDFILSVETGGKALGRLDP